MPSSNSAFHKSIKTVINHTVYAKNTRNLLHIFNNLFSVDPFNGCL